MKVKISNSVKKQGVPGYFTKGKVYQAKNVDSSGFNVECDDGEETYCLWKNCSHINGNWVKVKEN